MLGLQFQMNKEKKLIKKNKNNTTSYINTMELGKQRIELLKEYKIIKQVINFKIKKYIYKIKNVNVKEKQG